MQKTRYYVFSMGITRDLTEQIIPRFLNEEVVLISGPRQAGKTFVLHQLEEAAKTQGFPAFFLNLEDSDYLHLLNQSPKNLFSIFPLNQDKRSFIFIDEIQYLSDPAHFLKYLFDEHREKLKIIASGSSAFYLDRKFSDSLTGRKRLFTLLPLSFREFLRFKGETSLHAADFAALSLSEGEKLPPYYFEFLTYGGYPKVVLAPAAEKEEVLRDLAYSYVKKDIFEAKVRQEEAFYRLLKILAAQIGNLVNASELAATLGVSKSAVDNYLAIAQRSFHLALVRPFFRNIRKELTKMPKVYFYDLGLRNFFKREFRPFMERDDKGPLLENAVFRALLEKYDAEEIKFWRTADQKEVDFVIGENLALEVKLQGKKIRKRSYRQFMTQYPKIPLNYVSLGQASTTILPWNV